jgi:hypothetical protein
VLGSMLLYQRDGDYGGWRDQRGMIRAHLNPPLPRNS